MCYSALEHLLCVMSGSSKFTGIVGAKQMIVPLNKALSLKGLEINHALQSEEDFIECYRSTKKRIEFMESYSGLHVRHY